MPAREKLRALFADEEKKEVARRADLWHRAPSNARAAKELRRLLQSDLEFEDKIRRDLAASATKPTSELKQLDEDRAKLIEQLARVDALIDHLGS